MCTFAVDVEETTEAIESGKVDDDGDDGASRSGTELLLKTPEKVEKTDEEIGTEFLLEGAADGVVVADMEALRSSSSRRRLSRVDAGADQADESGPGREMRDITADAMSIQPTGYTLETAHVSVRCTA